MIKDVKDVNFSQKHEELFSYDMAAMFLKQLNSSNNKLAPKLSVQYID